MIQGLDYEGMVRDAIEDANHLSSRLQRAEHAARTAIGVALSREDARAALYRIHAILQGKVEQ